jgi:hypothetical protein
MRNRLLYFLGVIAALLFLPATFAQAQAIPDLMGIWNADFTALGGRFTKEDPPLTQQALAIFRQNREGLAFEETGLDERDPLTYCFPIGTTRQLLLRQFELVQSPKEVLLIHEFNSEVRRIYMDGRAHPDGWPFGWMGHSTGRYDGDSLVVDTVGFNDKTWLDRAGTPHSDALHVVERFRRPAQETLSVDLRFEDPKTFTRPWTASREFKLRPDLEVLEHVTCEDYLRIGND